jgi:hypothetical protein
MVRIFILMLVFLYIEIVLIFQTRDGIVGLATPYGLEGPGSNPGEARFSAPIQTGSGAHPASCTMGTGSFPVVKAAEA